MWTIQILSVYRSTQANQREEEYKNQIKTLTTRLKEVWNELERFLRECLRTLANCIVRTHPLVSLSYWIYRCEGCGKEGMGRSASCSHISFLFWSYFYACRVRFFFITCTSNLVLVLLPDASHSGPFWTHCAMLHEFSVFAVLCFR